jgi:penicillin amidase
MIDDWRKNINKFTVKGIAMQYGRVSVWFRRVLLLLVGLFAIVLLGLWLFLRGSLARLDGVQTAAGLHATVSVTRDAHGVPLISGSDRGDVAYATGFVHAQERFFQMDTLRRVAAGELSELFGSRSVGLDKLHRLHRFRARAELAVQALPPADRQLLERYVAGVNDGLDGLAARPFEYALIGVTPRAWSTADSFLVIWAMYFDLQGGLESRKLARGWLKEHSNADQLAFLLPQSTQWDAPLDAYRVAAPNAAIPAAAPDWWAKPRDKDALNVAAAEFLDSVGSNNWALAGSRSQSGAAIVSDDMHLGIRLPNTWYRLALQFPEAGTTRRVVGVSLPGTPAVVVGSNGHVAWGFTNSYGDYLDLIALDTDAGKPGMVHVPSGWETPVEHNELIVVKGAPPEKLLVRETSLGPIREVAGRSYAIHWVAHAPEAVNLNGEKLESANTLSDALAIAATMGIPAQNFVAGDDHGNIGWTVAGPLPRRAQMGLAASFPLGENDAAYSWGGWLTPAEYPQVRNPGNGQLWTANNRQLMNAGADLLGDGGFDLGARSQQVRDDLTALGAKADVKAVYGVTLDDRAIFLSGWRDRAMAALDADAIVQHPQRAQFLQLLKNGWTGHASVDSVAYQLTRSFMYALYDGVFAAANGEMAKLDDRASMTAATSRWPVVLARLLDERPMAWLPPHMASWQVVQLAAIDHVIADLTKDGKTLSSATWGEHNTAMISHPISFAVPSLRRWLVVPPDMLPGDSNMPRVAGPIFGQSERLTVSPGKEEEGIFNMPGGQSGHPLSPFFLAGHEDWVAGRTTPLLPGAAEHTLTFVK